MERYCINPDCSYPLNDEGVDECKECHTPLLINNRYWLVEQFGDKQVFKAKDCHPDTTEPWKVIKVVKATYSDEVKRLQGEADILRSPNLKPYGGIPHVKDECFFVESCDPRQQLYCLVMEFIDGQNLEQWLNSQGNLIYEKRARSWLKEIAEILKRMHGADIVHGDINPFNIMLRNGNLVLIDFGIATVEGSGLNGKRLGTPGYRAPEQEQEDGIICPQTDFYALGRTFVFLLTGKHPTELEEDSQTGQLMWRDSAPQVASGELKDLIDDLMAQSPNDRPKDAEAILQRLLPQSLSLGQGSGKRSQRDRNRIIQWFYKAFFLLLIPLISTSEPVRRIAQGWMQSIWPEISVSDSEWRATVFQCDKIPQSTPPVDFYKKDADNIGVLNLGSNDRGNGKKGIIFNWETGTPNNDSRLPSDFFAISSYTGAKFEAGKKYRFSVRGDDGFQLLAKKRDLPDTNPNKWVYITPKDQWQGEVYGDPKVFDFTWPSDARSGMYDFYFYYYEERGAAYFDLSWEEITPSNSTFHSVKFTGKVGMKVGVNLCLERKLNSCTSEQEPYNKTLNFDGWAYGETVKDIWTGDPDALWYKLSGQNRWVPSARINGYPPDKPPLQPTYSN